MFQDENRQNHQPEAQSLPQSDPQPSAQPEAQPQRPFPLPAPNQEIVRIILLGDYSGITRTIQQFAVKGIAEPKHWTRLMPTGRSGEYISIHTRRRAPETE
jgi:hypothetical protein